MANNLKGKHWQDKMENVRGLFRGIEVIPT
jgi:hypothetical protein